MESLVIIVFVLGYLAITLEHNLKIDKLIPALGMMAVIWALIGIWSKHTDPEQWNFQFPLVIKTTQACLVLVGSALFYSTYSSFTPKTTVR